MPIEYKRFEKPLGPQQQRILVRLGKGLEAKEIAEELGIAAGSVDTYTSSIFHKFGVHNKLEAVLHGVNHGHLDLKEVVDESKVELVESLSPHEYVVLGMIVANPRSFSFRARWKSVNETLDVIKNKLDVKSSIQAALIFLAAAKSSQSPDH